MTELEQYLPRKDIRLFAAGEAKRAYRSFGCHYLPQARAHRFLVWAPHAVAVSVVGEFNQWDPAAAPMARVEEGVFAALLPGLHSGMLYKYCVQSADGHTVYKADPFAVYAEQGGGNASRIWELDGYLWNDSDYLRRRAKRDPQLEPVSIYELHPGSWRWPEGRPPGYRQLADELAVYCRDMGYTHVELLPVTEYPFAESWGYQVSGYFAPTARYGTPQDFMYLVDRLHAENIGVLMDWVPAHFPRDQFGLARFDGTPQFEYADPRRGEHPQWGTLVFDYGKPEVRSFLISSAMLFLDRYHIDGLRVDAVSSMLYLDYGRGNDYLPNQDGGNINLEAVDFLRRLNSTLLRCYPGVMTVAEESTDYPLVTYPPEVGGLGFTFKWDMGFMHDTLEYLSLDHLFRRDNHSKLTFSMLYAFSERFILAFSHDEVVHGKKSLLDKMFGSYEEKFAALRALFAYQFAHPGKKLNFMGAEFGQFIEWNHHHQLDWLLLDYPAHRGVHEFMRELNRLYRAHPALYTIEDCWDGFSWLNVDDNQRSSVAFLRKDLQGDTLVCAYNFTPVRWPDFTVGLPGRGRLTLLLNSDDTRFGGAGTQISPVVEPQRQPFLGREYSAALDLPPLSALWFVYTPEPAKAGDIKDTEKTE